MNGKRRTTEDFINDSQLIHEDKYEYSKSIFTKRKSKVIIICPIHGEFEQTPHSHLNGHHCRKCSMMNKDNGFGKSYFLKFCNKNNNGLGTFYILKCFNEDEEFYKIGITSHSIKKRYESKKDLPYNYEIIYEYFNNPEYIFNLETLIKHKVLKGLNYKCKLFFGGCRTEVFKLSSTNLDKVISLLK